MPLKFQCAFCGKVHVSRFLKAGEKFKCRNCGNSTTIPENASFIDENKIHEIVDEDIQQNEEIEKTQDNSEFSYKFFEVEFESTGLLGIEKMACENFKEVIIKFSKMGYRYSGWLPEAQESSRFGGYINKITLIFEKKKD